VSISDEQIEFVKDLFAQVGPISTRKMFGGLGVYTQGTIFALVMSDGAHMLKGVGPMVEAYTDEGWQQWTYARKGGGKSAMPYWQMPDALLDDPDEASHWARRALQAL